ncbi:MAG: nitrous oxide reductase family maturation protein NosD [Chitinophagaceae bacterium]|nr:nitrous oxide reductase family maturation protein NosD [Chitinophagaceae bacterium]
MVAKFILVVSFLFISPAIHATVWKVGEQGKLKSIKEALRIAKAKDTILVSKGTYQEKNIVIEKAIVLLGNNMPVLDGEDRFEIISVKSNDVVIDGFHLIRSGYSDIAEMSAIKIYYVHHVVIRHNFFDDTYFGVYNLSATKCFIINNRFLAKGADEMKSGNGIHCWHCDSMIISGNTITGHRDGIYFEFVSNSVISENRSIHNVRYGLHFMFSHSNIFDKNFFTGNGSGCAVMFSHNVTMTNNTFSENWGSASYGILMKEISDSYVKGNQFSQNTSGIYMEGTNRIEVLNNDFSKNGTAMRMQASCSGNTIRANNFMSNTFDVATNGSLVLNVLAGNYWDKYLGYDLDRNGVGDVPFHPITFYSMLTEQVPEAMMLLHSFMVTLLDNVEKIIPTITPENFLDATPAMKPLTT